MESEKKTCVKEYVISVFLLRLGGGVHSLAFGAHKGKQSRTNCCQIVTPHHK